MNVVLLIAASVIYAVGGLFMKASHGATRLPATAAFVMLFVIGAVAQARGMRDADLSTTYILVLGVEAVAAVLLGTWLLHETLSPSRVAATCLVVVGVAWLRLL